MRSRRFLIEVSGIDVHEETALREFLYQCIKKYKKQEGGWVCLYIDAEEGKPPPKIRTGHTLENLERLNCGTGKFLPDAFKVRSSVSNDSTVCVDADYSFTWEDEDPGPDVELPPIEST